MIMIRLFFIMTVLTGVIYPLGVTLFSQIAFSHQANGSMTNMGSTLISQKFTSDDYFHSRPSAADYATVASGASQTSPTHREGKEKYEQRKKDFPHAGEDFWTSSGSGLDPHLSPSSAFSQVSRIAKQRGMEESKLAALINEHTEDPTWGIWGQSRVNVLELNIALFKEAHVHAGSAPQRP